MPHDNAMLTCCHLSYIYYYLFYCQLTLIVESCLDFRADIPDGWAISINWPAKSLIYILQVTMTNWKSMGSVYCGLHHLFPRLCLRWTSSSFHLKQSSSTHDIVNQYPVNVDNLLLQAKFEQQLLK